MRQLYISILLLGTVLLSVSTFGAQVTRASDNTPQRTGVDIPLLSHSTGRGSTGLSGTFPAWPPRTTSTRPSVTGPARLTGASPALPPGGRHVSPARIRTALLYRGGEFSTFRRRSPVAAGVRYETAQQTASLDRRVEDEWIALDKAKHVAFSFLWTLGIQYTAVNKGGLSEHRALPISISSSALIGISKEVYDLRAGPSHTFSVRDLVADAAGIALGIGLILL